MDEPLSHYPEKEKGAFSTIFRGPEVREPCVFLNGMYLSVFYCLCRYINFITQTIKDRKIHAI